MTRIVISCPICYKKSINILTTILQPNVLYEDFKITLLNNSSIRCSFRGREKDGTFDPEGLDQEIKDLSNTKLIPTFTQKGIQDIGERLANALFSEGVKQFFDKALETQKDNGLRILLKLDSHYVDYPWEIMYRNGVHIATDIKTPLIRVYDGDNTLPVPVNSNKDKIPNLLVIGSSVVGLSTVDVQGELNIINGNIEPHKELVNMNIVNLPTRINIEKALNTQSLDGNPINIVHFIGHGKFENGVTSLALRKGGGGADEGEVDDADEDTVDSLFQNENSIVLMIINACYGGKIEAGQDSKPFSYSGLIPKLIRRIPAIIAMRQTISNTASRIFSDALYPNVVALQIEEAIQRARNSMYINNNCKATDFSIPVIFLGSRNGITIKNLFTKNLPGSLYDDYPTNPVGNTPVNDIIEKLFALSKAIFALNTVIDAFKDSLLKEETLKYLGTHPSTWDYAFDNVNSKYSELVDIITQNFPETGKVIQQFETNRTDPVDRILTCFKNEFSSNTLPDEGKIRKIRKELKEQFKQMEKQFIDFNKTLYYNITSELREK
jgi:hypothetical protein